MAASALATPRLKSLLHHRTVSSSPPTVLLFHPALPLGLNCCELARPSFVLVLHVPHMSSPALDPAHRRFSADIPVGRQSATADDNDDEDEDGWSEDYDDPVDDVPRKRKRATKTVGAGGSRPMSVSCE